MGQIDTNSIEISHTLITNNANCSKYIKKYYHNFLYLNDIFIKLIVQFQVFQIEYWINQDKVVVLGQNKIVFLNPNTL